MSLNPAIIIVIAVVGTIFLSYIICCLLFRCLTNHGPEAITLTKNLDLSNKVIIITGANSGIGAETTRVLAHTKATIIMACRTVSRGETVKNRIIKETSNKNIFVMKCDLGSIKGITEFVNDIAHSID